MSNEKITVEDLVDAAIVEGYQRGAATFLESVESDLQTAVLLSENEADAMDVLQVMIDESEGEAVHEESTEHLSELDQKMARLFRS